MIVPTAAPAFFSYLNKLALPTAVLWVAMSSLLWLPADLSAPTVVLGACQALGIAQLFGGLLMLSPCTLRTGSMWSAGVFTLTALVALVTLQGWLALAAFGLAAWCGANLALPANEVGR